MDNRLAMLLKKIVLFCVFSFFICLDLFSEIEKTSFLRKDGSAATAYIGTPDNSDSFPVVIYIDGSHMQTVKNNFSVLSHLYNSGKIGIVAIEKRGITEDAINVNEFHAYDCYENRLEDYIQLVNELNEKATKWNGQIIFLGSSEGGKIAPKLTLHFADKTMGTILISSGGGLPFGEEIKYQIKQIAIENNNEFNESKLDRQIEDQYEMILNHPYSLKKYYDKTYKWFASYLKNNLLEDILCINAPILMVHGALDDHIPVESADFIKTAFDEMGKENLTYLRYEDLAHSISKRKDIFMLLLSFSSEHFHSEAAVRF